MMYMGNISSASLSTNRKVDDSNIDDNLHTKLYIWGQDLLRDKEKQFTEKNAHFADKIDYIASQYILTIDFNTMKNLHNKSYCDKLVMLTGDILNRYYSEIDIKQMRDRVEHGETVIYAQKKDIDHISNKLSDCNQIAKFYVKIGHLFAAIMMTIHPKYEYIDHISGDKVTKTLRQKNDIPDGIEVKQYSNGLCYEKMNILLGNLHGEVENKDSLMDEPGIPELINLYYDSEYDYTTGEFHGMTEKTRSEFQRDLEEFYKVFTKNKTMPSNITKFSDIKLNHYSDISINIEPDSQPNFNNVEKESDIDDDANILESFSIRNKNTNKNGQFGGKRTTRVLIKNYANNLNTMMRNVNYYQKKLLDIINSIFIYTDDNKTIRIEPRLTEKQLYKYIEESRSLIVEMYLNCEENFLKGIQIYEAIVENIMFRTTQNQIDSLEMIMLNIHSPIKNPKDNPLSNFVNNTMSNYSILSTPIPNIQNTINFFRHSV